MKKRKRRLSVSDRHRIDRMYSFMWGVIFTVAFLVMCFKYHTTTNKAFQITGEYHNYIESSKIIKGNN